jgi:hypothetical protein
MKRKKINLMISEINIKKRNNKKKVFYLEEQRIRNPMKLILYNKNKKMS